jgi:hypothetical protein
MTHPGCRRMRCTLWQFDGHNAASVRHLPQRDLPVEPYFVFLVSQSTCCGTSRQIATCIWLSRFPERQSESCFGNHWLNSPRNVPKTAPIFAAATTASSRASDRLKCSRISDNAPLISAKSQPAVEEVALEHLSDSVLHSIYITANLKTVVHHSWCSLRRAYRESLGTLTIEEASCCRESRNLKQQHHL